MANVVVEAQYVADTTRYVRSLRQASEETARFAREIPEAVQATDKLKASSIGLSAALGTVGAIIGAKAIGAIQKYAMQGIAAAKQYEQTVISIEGIFAGTGMSMEAAAEKTKSYLADLRDFAAKTPFELPQVLDAVKRLLSIGYAADDVKNRMLPAIGDIVAALGQPPSAVSAVVYAFGQMKSAGRVLSQDLMQIGNALPGFNAKMALASKLFQGDMFALTKAMESGALDSTKAIDAIIEAMTEFGGAQGAMARQSQTLVGVMSTFADTVNNALIDGLMPSLPVLSATLNEVMPEVQALATAFAQALGPALIDGADTIGRLAPVITEVLPPIIEMASQLTSLSDVLVAFAPALEFAANIVGIMADALNALPAPIYAAVASLLVMRALLKKFGMDAGMAATGVGAAMARIKAAVISTTETIRLSFMLAGTSLKAVSLSAKTLGASFVATMRSMGLAVKGFMASLGPVGWAIIAASAAFEIFGGKAAQAEALVQTLKATVDETTGAFGELTAAALANQLRLDLSLEDQAALAQMGISIEDMTRAIMDGGPAVEELNSKFDGLVGSANGVFDVFGGKRDLLIIAQRNFQGLSEAADQTRIILDAEAKSAAEAARITATSAQEVATLRRKNAAEERAQLAQRRADYLAMSATERTAATQAAIANGIKEAAERKLEAATTALKNAYAQTQKAVEKLNAFLSEQASMDAARAAVDDLSKSLKENGKTMSSHTEKGRANRAAVRDVIQSYVDWAMATEDPIKQQKRLQEAEDKLRKQLGKKQYEKLGVTQAFQEAKTETQKYAKEWEKAADDAKRAGNDVGYEFVRGIIEGLKANKNALEAAGAEAGSTVVDGARGPDGINSGSPSKKAIKLGKEFIDGLMLGLDQMGLLKGKGASLGSGLTAAVRDAIKSGGSVSDMLSGMLGGLPSLPTPLEMALGGPDKVEKWKKKHEKQLMELARMAAELDQAIAQIRSGQEAMASIGSMTARPMGMYKGAAIFGESDLSKAIGSKGNLDSAIRMFDELASATEQGYQSILALTKKGEKAKVQAQRAEAAAQIDGFRQEVAGYMLRRQQIEQELSNLEQSYSQQVSDINAHYDALDRAAADNLRAIEAKWDASIKVLEQQLQAATAAFDKENAVLQQLLQERDGFLKKIADGFRSYAMEISRDGGSFVDSITTRLQDVQKFSQNIRTLLARGLDPAIVRDFVEAGVAGAGTAAAELALASDEEIARINQAQTDLSAAILEFQTLASQQWYAAGIAQQQAIVAPLEAAKIQAEQQLLLANQFREQEIAAARAYQEQLRLEREAALKAAQETYLAERQRLEAEAKDINEKLDARADSILVYFLALKEVMQKKMLELGKQIIGKMIAGLEAREGELYAKAQRIANEIERIIKDALGIESPSQAMIGVGEMIAAGLALGMENGIGEVQAAARSLSNAGMQVDVGALSPSIVARELSGISYTGGPVAGLNPTEVNVSPGAVQISFPTGSMDALSAQEIQRIIDDAFMNLAREIRRT